MDNLVNKTYMDVWTIYLKNSWFHGKSYLNRPNINI